MAVGPFVELGAELRLIVAAVEHPRQEIVVHIVAAQLPLPRGHPVFGQVAACQRRSHLHLPYLAVCHDAAAQHTVHLTAAQLVVHHQAVVLPAAVGVLVHLRQAHILKHRPRTFDESPQLLFRPFLFHAFLPIFRAGFSFPALCLCTVPIPDCISFDYSTMASRLPAKRTIFKKIFYNSVNLRSFPFFRPVPWRGSRPHTRPQCGRPAGPCRSRRRHAMSSCRPACRGCSDGPPHPAPASLPWG